MTGSVQHQHFGAAIQLNVKKKKKKLKIERHIAVRLQGHKTRCLKN